MLGLAPVVSGGTVRTSRIATTKHLHTFHVPLVARLGRLGNLVTSVLRPAVLLHDEILADVTATVKGFVRIILLVNPDRLDGPVLRSRDENVNHIVVPVQAGTNNNLLNLTSSQSYLNNFTVRKIEVVPHRDIAVTVIDARLLSVPSPEQTDHLGRKAEAIGESNVSVVEFHSRKTSRLPRHKDDNSGSSHHMRYVTGQ
jgi:hypothetical protein